MKSTLTILLTLTVVFMTIFAQWNYQDAMNAASLSEGCEADTMKAYGFNSTEQPNTIEKIKALYYK